MLALICVACGEEDDDEPKRREADVALVAPTAGVGGLVITQSEVWVIDGSRQELTRIARGADPVVASVSLELAQPHALAWDGTDLWTLDNDTKRIYRLAPATAKILASFDVPIPTGVDATLTGLAWDGSGLWIAYEAGWSSRILRMDPKTGDIVGSMFARCLPKGLATDGKYLWVLSDNLGQALGMVSERVIQSDLDAMNLTREFLGRTSGRFPTALGFDGEALWVADAETKEVRRFPVLR